jgi:hypothetical protein
MNCSLRMRTWCTGLVSVAVVLGCTLGAFGQADPTQGALAADKGLPRKLAPGVMQSVDPHLQEAETVTRRDVPELLSVDPDFPGAKPAVFRREVWYLDFQFKPMRMILVDIPQPGGRMKQKLIWYMVYSVTNPGKIMPSVAGPDGTYQLQDSDKTVRYVPAFYLESHEFGLLYPDRIIPLAVAAIQMREDPNRDFYNSVEIVRDLKVGETVWGVITWEDVDPRIDRFSIYVNGLTNAYQWEDVPGDATGKGRKLFRKTLKLNFWRPGDEFYEHEKEFRFGIPGEPDYEWVYRDWTAR